MHACHDALIRMQAQQYIRATQHPRDCSRAKFLVFTAHRSGVGSVFHQMSVALALAVSEGRVFVEPEGQYLAEDEYCPPGRKSVMACYFRPPPCTLSSDEIAAAVAWAGPGMHNASRVVRVSTDVKELRKQRLFVPHVFREWLRGSAVDPQHYHSWWRAQAAVYQVQPNERTLAELEARRKWV